MASRVGIAGRTTLCLGHTTHPAAENRVRPRGRRLVSTPCSERHAQPVRSHPEEPPASAPHLASSPSSGLTFAWPDGTTVLRDLDLLVPPGRSGLVGVNGAGKSTLLRLVAGPADADPWDTSPSPARSATCHRTSPSTSTSGSTTSSGIGEVRRAVRAVEGGAVDPAHLFDTIGDDWDAEDPCGRRARPAGAARRRARPTSRRAVRRRGQPARPRAAAAGSPRRAAPRRADQQPRRRRPRRPLYDVVETWTRSLLVVSHDRELLERMDRIGDLRRRPGPVVRRRLRRVRRPGRGRAGGRRAGGEHRPLGRTASAQRPRGGRAPAGPAPAQGQKPSARRHREEGATPTRTVPRDPRGLPQGPRRPPRAGPRTLDAAESRLREDREDPGRPAGDRGPPWPGGADDRGSFPAHRGTCGDQRHGPDRIGVVGPNGSGKTTLLHMPARWRRIRAALARTCRSALLPQRLDVLDRRRTPSSATLRAGHPALDSTLIRARLARFLFRGAAADRLVGRRSRVVSASAPPSPRCCWPTRRRSCCCSTSRPTTSTSRRTTRWCRRWPPTAARSSWSATTPGFLEDIGVERGARWAEKILPTCTSRPNAWSPAVAPARRPRACSTC